MSLHSGKIEIDLTLTPGSMSAAIEAALESLVPLGAGEDPMGRRKFALAIARGVLKHVRDNASALRVVVPDAPGGSTHSEPAAADVDLGGWS